MDEKTSSKGVIINGEPGSGKTAAILQLVESSCFGRGQSGLAGKIFFFANIICATMMKR